MAAKAAWFQRLDWTLLVCLLLPMSPLVHLTELLIRYLKICKLHKVPGNECSALTVVQLLVFCHFYICFVFIYVFPV